MRIIGITGGVGAGKTKILSYIKEHYRCRIYLADEVAKQIQRPGEVCYDRIVERFGPQILAEDLSIDRMKLAAEIFCNKESLLAINDIVHPAVREYLETAAQSAKDEGVELFFIEAALLIETGYKNFVDEMWYVHAPDEIRRERLREGRGYDEEKITQIMDSQLSDEAFIQNSDFVIDNGNTLEEAYECIRKRLEAYTWQE